MFINAFYFFTAVNKIFALNTSLKYFWSENLHSRYCSINNNAQGGSRAASLSNERSINERKARNTVCNFSHGNIKHTQNHQPIYVWNQNSLDDDWQSMSVSGVWCRKAIRRVSRWSIFLVTTTIIKCLKLDDLYTLNTFKYYLSIIFTMC